MLYIHNIHVCTQNTFSTMLDYCLRKKNKKKGEIGKHKLNEMGALNMK